MVENRLLRGRGAQSANVSQRFNLPDRNGDPEWLDQRSTVDGPASKLRTSVTEEHPRTILTFNQSPDIGFDRSINVYRGCEHGCAYCYARPSHAYMDLSPGLDFETKLFAKPNAPELLRKTLAKKGYAPRPIAMGTNTDPYQPIEGQYRLTREILRICLDTRHPVLITTKSDRVLRDLDLIEQLAMLRLIYVSISVTSLDAKLSSKLEPRAATPARRLAALARLAQAGVPTNVSIAPVIPAITDCDMEAILEQAGKAGVETAGWILLRLPHEVAPLFREWLDAHYPDRADKVMAIVRSSRQGRNNDPAFFSRFRPQGVWPQLFRDRFRLARKKAGIGTKAQELDCSAFRLPQLDPQMDLFDEGRVA